MAILSPREELLAIQKKIYRSNQRLINDSVVHEDRSFQNYERRYLRAVSRYCEVASYEALFQRISKSDIVLVGDYHTLNQSQRSFLRLCRHYVAQDSQFAIFLEVIQVKHQTILDQYLSDKIVEATFLKKIGFREHWFFDLWANFKPLFDFARHHGLPVRGLEEDPRLGLNLLARDQAWATTIAHYQQKHPDQKLFVLVGDLHLAPTHLAKSLLKHLPHLRILTLYQNSVAIYWQLAAQGLEDQVNLVKISDDEFCRVHTPPIICQQSYLNWLEHEEGELDYTNARQIFLDYLHQIAELLEIKVGPEVEDVEVFTSGDLSFLKKLKESKVFSQKELREIKRQILRSESYTIPKTKYVYLANLSVNHAAEEAAHTLKFLTSGQEFPRPMQDAFYMAILHEALGYFGSKLINHKRKCLRPQGARKLIEYLAQSGAKAARMLEYEIAKGFLEHETAIKQNRPFKHARIAGLSIDLFLGLTHAMGYYLGEKMFYGLLQGKISKDEIRHKFYDPIVEEGVPFVAYLALYKKTRGVTLPKRL